MKQLKKVLNKFDITNQEYDVIYYSLENDNVYVKKGLSPNSSLWYKIEDDILYIRATQKEGYNERILYTDPTLSKNGWRGDDTITKVIIEDEIFPTSCVRLFDNCSNIIYVDGINKLHMDFCTNAVAMFQNCKKMISIGNLSNWNTSNVTNMSYMFNMCESINSFGDLSNWDTSNVTNMTCMFQLCRKITDVGDLSNWDTSNVTDMSYMFNNCESLKYIKLKNWNLASCLTLCAMFAGNDNGELDDTIEIDLTNWHNMNNITDMKWMFAHNESLQTIKGLESFDTSNVTTMNRMFDDISVKELNLINFDLSKCSNLTYMIWAMPNLETLILNSNFFTFTPDTVEFYYITKWTHDSMIESLYTNQLTRDISNVKTLRIPAECYNKLSDDEIANISDIGINIVNSNQRMIKGIEELDDDSIKNHIEVY